MSTKKKIAAVLITVAALSGGSITIATADHGPAKDVTKSAERAAKHAEKQANRTANQALVAATIGIDSATIKTRLQAGETLAAIAGTKKDALIAVLVDLKSKKIDARVAAGAMTAADATTRKAALVAKVTEHVNAVGHKGMGHGKMGKMGKGKRH